MFWVIRRQDPWTPYGFFLHCCIGKLNYLFWYITKMNIFLNHTFDTWAIFVRAKPLIRDTLRLKKTIIFICSQFLRLIYSLEGQFDLFVLFLIGCCEIVNVFFFFSGNLKNRTDPNCQMVPPPLEHPVL